MKKMLTPFGEKIDRNCPLSEYPRPQLKRDSYLCLNGEWDYAILPKEEQLKSYQGKILVPFSPESVLSGVERTVTDKDKLYYRRYFELKRNLLGRVLLNSALLTHLSGEHKRKVHR